MTELNLGIAKTNTPPDKDIAIVLEEMKSNLKQSINADPRTFVTGILPPMRAKETRSQMQALEELFRVNQVDSVPPLRAILIVDASGVRTRVDASSFSQHKEMLWDVLKNPSVKIYGLEGSHGLNGKQFRALQSQSPTAIPTNQPPSAPSGISSATPPNLNNIEREVQLPPVFQFSTGIDVQGGEDDWVSTGFTGRYSNITPDLQGKIPVDIIRAIANSKFSVAEGSSDTQSSIISQIVGKYFVVCKITRGEDKQSRGFGFDRYFFIAGASLTQQKTLLQACQDPSLSYNPFAQIRGSQESSTDFCNLPSVKTSIDIPLSGEQLNRLAKGYKIGYPLVLSGDPKLTVTECHQLSQALKRRFKLTQPPSVAYDVKAVEEPGNFLVIQPLDQASEDALKKDISIKRGQIQKKLEHGEPTDPQLLKGSIKGIINNNLSIRNIPQELITIFELAFVDYASNPAKKSLYEDVFEIQGFDKALDLRMNSPQMIRLISLRLILDPTLIRNQKVIAYMSTMAEKGNILKKSRNMAEVYTLPYLIELNSVITNPQLKQNIQTILSNYA